MSDVLVKTKSSINRSLVIAAYKKAAGLKKPSSTFSIRITDTKIIKSEGAADAGRMTALSVTSGKGRKVQG